MHQGKFIAMLLENDICFRVAKAILLAFWLQGHNRFIVDIDSISYSVQTTWKTLTVYLGLSPCPVTATTRIIRFLVGDPYKPSFPTVPWKGDNPTYIKLPVVPWFSESSDLVSCISWENSHLFLCRLLSCISNLSKFLPPQKKMEVLFKKKCHLRSTKFSIIFVGCPPLNAVRRISQDAAQVITVASSGQGLGQGENLLTVSTRKIYISDWKSSTGVNIQKIFWNHHLVNYIYSNQVVGFFFAGFLLLMLHKNGKFIVGRTKLVCLTAFSAISLRSLSLSEQYHAVFCIPTFPTHLRFYSRPFIRIVTSIYNERLGAHLVLARSSQFVSS